MLVQCVGCETERWILEKIAKVVCKSSLYSRRMEGWRIIGELSDLPKRSGDLIDISRGPGFNPASIHRLHVSSIWLHGRDYDILKDSSSDPFQSWRLEQDAVHELETISRHHFGRLPLSCRD